MLKCSDAGGYYALCRNRVCYCLNATNGNYIGQQINNANIDDIDCGELHLVKSNVALSMHCTTWFAQWNIDSENIIINV